MVDVFIFLTEHQTESDHTCVQTTRTVCLIIRGVLEDFSGEYLRSCSSFTESVYQRLTPQAVDRGRSKMTKEFPGGEVRSHKMKRGIHCTFMTTQMPLPTTVSDFWSMVIDNKPSTVVMLNDKSQNDKGIHCTFMTTQMPLPTTVSDFWSMVLNNKPSTVVMLNDKSQNDKGIHCTFMTTQMPLPTTVSDFWSMVIDNKPSTVVMLNDKSQNDKTSHTVTQYQFHGWPKHGSDQQLGARSLIKLIRAIKGSTNSKKEFSILVHCLSGAGRTGVFCTAMECIAQIAEGDSVDIFQTVKILRADRMQFVQTEEEYAFVYDVNGEYLHTENYEQLLFNIKGVVLGEQVCFALLWSASLR
eukprot:XP_011668216.1 PREDICTED: receptor-type tyrosine-protein phosphatase epsilon [Strongylocentrotus purpuratus]